MDSLALFEGENIIEINFKKFHRTNQNTVHNQRPLVTEGTKVKIGDVIADGASTDNGELALGSNIKVAFMPWRGYNFEDAIVISERLVKDDIFSSVHCNEVELEVRDTKRGQEELTAEIPNVGEDATKDLDENGIIRLGCSCRRGRYTNRKSDSQRRNRSDSRRKLLRAIFGEKSWRSERCVKESRTWYKRGCTKDTAI